MSKAKAGRRKYRVVRTDTLVESQDKNAIQVLAGAAGTVAALLVREYVKTIPDYIALPVAFIFGWFAIVHLGCFSFFRRKYIHYPMYVVAIGASLILCQYIPSTKTRGTLNGPATSVVSHGQNGGITAQTVKSPTINNNQTINNYFIDQPPDEKEKWRQYLTKEYSLGWCIYGTDGTTFYAPPGLSYEKDHIVMWGGQGVVSLTPDFIQMRPPDVYIKGSKGIVAENIVGKPRRVGEKLGLVLLPGDIAVDAEILEDHRDFVVLAVGFHKITQP